MSLKGKVLFVTGASRGIGLAIALRAARDGAHVAIAAKTTTPNPKLPGTIYTAAEELERAGGKALPLVCDIRDEAAVESAIKKTVETFGGIDIVINNASAINLTNTQNTTLKKYNLMNEINTRGTWLVTKHAIPHLLESNKRNRNPHILNISPPLSMKEHWFSGHVAYTIAKYGMSMCVLGWAGEFKGQIAVNALWPLTTIDTAALNVIDPNLSRKSRKPQVMADAAHILFTKTKDFTGNFCIDEILLRDNGQTDLAQYSCVPNTEPAIDYFVDDETIAKVNEMRKAQRSKL